MHNSFIIHGIIYFFSLKVIKQFKSVKNKIQEDQISKNLTQTILQNSEKIDRLLKDR
jgi:tartrate dehydratase alpha subunit/fumarate hydratase class I-like protein